MKDYDVQVVIGANYGDEGKGVVTNTLLLESYQHDRTPIMVLHNGGPQRGHTVHYQILGNSGYHIFRHRGSAISGISMSTPTYLSPTFLINPLIFIQESKELISKHFIVFRTRQNVFVNEHCKVITPVDMLLNQVSSSLYHSNCTCGQGINTTLQRHGNSIRYEDPMRKHLQMTMKDLLQYSNEDSLLEILSTSYTSYLLDEIEALMKQYQGTPSDLCQSYLDIVYDRRKLYHILENYVSDCNAFIENTQMVSSLQDTINKYYPEVDRLLFENGQGLALDDLAQGDPLYLTPSRTGSHNIEAILTDMKSSPSKISRFYVTRTYLTRHGNGPMEAEVLNASDISSGILVKEETNKTNTWQGRFRYGHLNLYTMMTRIGTDRMQGLSPSMHSMYQIEDYLAITHTNETDQQMCFQDGKKRIDDLALLGFFPKDHILTFPEKTASLNREVINRTL